MKSPYMTLNTTSVSLYLSLYYLIVLSNKNYTCSEEILINVRVKDEGEPNSYCNGINSFSVVKNEKLFILILFS